MKNELYTNKIDKVIIKQKSLKIKEWLFYSIKRKMNNNI